MTSNNNESANEGPIMDVPTVTNITIAKNSPIDDNDKSNHYQLNFLVKNNSDNYRFEKAKIKIQSLQIEGWSQDIDIENPLDQTIFEASFYTPQPIDSADVEVKAHWSYSYRFDFPTIKVKSLE